MNLFANFNVKPSHLQTSLNDYNSNVCFHVFKPPKFEHTKSLSLCNLWALTAWIPGSIFPTTNLILNAVLWKEPSRFGSGRAYVCAFACTNNKQYQDPMSSLGWNGYGAIYGFPSIPLHPQISTQCAHTLHERMETYLNMSTWQQYVGNGISNVSVSLATISFRSNKTF